MKKKPASGSARAQPRDRKIVAKPRKTSTPAPEPHAERPTPRAVPVVGVGASAGGLDAFTRMLQALPRHPGFALVFVQHLSPTHDSALSELLAKATTLPVEQVRNGMIIAVDHVYVVPPNAELTIEAGHLRVSPRPTDRSQYNPIDAFFRSLAEWSQASAFGVLLSGTSSDGVAGLREVRAAGGTVLVQDPQTTEFDAMPRAAITAGVADLILAPNEISLTLLRLMSHAPQPPSHLDQPGPQAVFADRHLHRVFTLLRGASGVDFSHYKEPTIRRRLNRRMLLRKVSNIQAYVALLDEDPAELQSLYQDLLIQVTRFFREPDSYAAMVEKVFPRLVSERTGDSPIRIWIPGCATGEEAYSVAISLLEFLGDAASETPVQVFATDVSDRAIERARSGVYPDSITDDVSPQRLRRFFTKVDGSYQISKMVRDLCVFAHQDLTRDPPFSKLDLIVCRNVLIYLDPVLHKKLMSLFHYALKAHGFLILGRAESTGPYSDLFQPFEKKHRIYVRKPSAIRMDLDFQPADPASNKGQPGRRQAPRGRDGGGFQSEATRMLVSRYAPPGVIVDSDLRIVQTRGQTGAFLELAAGEPTLDLFNMLREGLLLGVRSALNEARKSNQIVRKSGVKVRSNGHSRAIDVEVIPLAGASPAERHYLVLFDDPQIFGTKDGSATPAELAGMPANGRPRGAGQKMGKAKGRPGAKARSADEQRMVEMQHELAASREYLQSIIQDLEATNEELQSANEEILSANEELQSTNEELDTAKEELQSTNEEINTVNEELQSRNEELSRANSDLVNLLGGVQIAIVFLTDDLRIRRFTPMAEKALNLIAGDVGRPIGNIRPNIDCPDLEALIQDAIDNVTVKEREVQDRDGNWLLLRIRPYKSVDNRIDGAVLVLLDIDALRKHEMRSQQAEELATAIMDGYASALLVVDGQIRVVTTNRLFEQKLGVVSAHIRGKAVSEIGKGQWDLTGLSARLSEFAGGSQTETGGELTGAHGQRLRFMIRKLGEGRRAPLLLLTIDEGSGG